jgi:hypothetical protein
MCVFGRVQLENCQVYMFCIYAYRRRRSSPEEIAGGGCSPEQGRRERASCASEKAGLVGEIILQWDEWKSTGEGS